MEAGEFRTVVVPVEFDMLEADETSDGDVVVIGDGVRVAIGPVTLAALKLAARLGHGGELFLVHARHDLADHATWMDAKDLGAANSGAARHAIEVLEAIGARHCAGVGVRPVVAAGNVLDVILGEVARRSADAIVLAASSRGRWSRAIHGSTADKLIRRAPCPVVVVPAHSRGRLQ
jgi:nucleotide-binding universal stress UspA family protein